MSKLRLGTLPFGLLVLFLARGVVGISSGFAEEQRQVDGALPVGFHDGSYGEVPDVGNCAAFGWAVDPDNRDRDVQVRILSDGNEEAIASLPAGDYGSDMDEEGICPGGTCRFTVSLWDLISHRESHEIRVQAFDEETRVWVDLWDTPKSLTCMGYPEGWHDGAGGLIEEPLNCNASGWAVDPEDRSRDLDVQILLDGIPVATAIAGELRENVGACDGGTCGFNVNIWGLISPGVEHEITAQVQDLETAEWIKLSGTPKALTCTEASVPSPYLRAFPDWDFVDGYNWPAGQSVGLKTADKEFNATADGEGFVGFELVGYDLVQGDPVRMSSGGLVVEHVVKLLFINEVNMERQTVAGTVNGKEEVHVFSGPADEYIWSDENGNWSVHLLGAEDPVLYPGACVSAEAWDTGTANSTIVQLCIPEPPPVPFIWADPVGEFINGWDWPGDSTVGLLITRDSAKLYSDSQPADGSGAVGFNLYAAGVDLQAGDHVLMQDGVTTKDLWVTDLAITQISINASTISGVYDPSYGFRIHVEGREADQLTFAGNEWTAAFTEMGQGECGEVSQPDDEGDQTGFGFCTPNPWFGVFPKQEVVEGWEWVIGEIVHLEIDGASGHFETYGEVVPAEWDGATPWLWIDFASEYDVQAGDVVTLSGSSGTNWHVVRALELTGVDPIENTFTGTADPGADVRIRPHAAEQTLMTVTANADGVWFADLDDVGYELMAGEAIRASIVDERNNETAVDRDVWLPIRIDIKPFNRLNQVACRFPSSLIPVALISAEDFDALSVDPDSIRFGRTGYEAEVIRVGRDQHPARYQSDVDGDGMEDVIYYFRLGDTGFSCADIPDGRHSVRVDAVLTAWTADFGVWGVDFLRLYRLFD